MKLVDLLEAPLKDISYHRAGEQGSFSEKDRKLLHQFTVTKHYHEKLKAFPLDLFIYIIDADGLRRIGKGYPERVIKADDFTKPERFLSQVDYQSKYLNHDRDDLQVNKSTLDSMKLVFDEVKKNQKNHPRALHFIMGDNFSNTHQVGPTPWILVHRLFHCLTIIKDEEELMSEIFDVIGRVPLKDIFTFKSAKNDHLGDDFEIYAELATQYTLTGDIPLVKFKKELKPIINRLKKRLDSILKHAEGKVVYI